MQGLLNAGSAAIFAKATRFLSKISCSSYGVSAPFYRNCFENGEIRRVKLESWFARFRLECYSSQSSISKKSRSKKSEGKLAVKDEKDAFFVVRKGDLVGVYKNLSDCQAQIGYSIRDPPVSVFKGYSLLPKAEEYLQTHGLKNPLYSIKASDLCEELFGTLVHCPFQQPASSKNEKLNDDPAREQLLEPEVSASKVGCSCIIEFDGASKGNPGRAGAGAVLQTDDGNLICRLRQGLGVATNNVAEYGAIILGLRYALKKGFTHIRVQGDSKLVYMQLQGLWKVKNQNLFSLYEEAKELKDKFLSVQFVHVLRELNSEADAQANLAVHLADGEVQEETIKETG